MRCGRKNRRRQNPGKPTRQVWCRRPSRRSRPRPKTITRSSAWAAMAKWWPLSRITASTASRAPTTATARRIATPSPSPALCWPLTISSTPNGYWAQRSSLSPAARARPSNWRTPRTANTRPNWRRAVKWLWSNSTSRASSIPPSTSASATWCCLSA